ncbi:MAG: type II toxin-antitoxin system HicB family antitoxin [Cyclobacteriaceae bacterium]|jgi:predicted HicB family RNase H-like nuclease|nr:type II toxin-antitoxin system HicB family antitoxin [Flammeovirgaceae bacterium]
MMKNALQYKGYSAIVEFSAEDDAFFGRILGIRDVVTFEADNVTKLKKSFKEAVDDYLETCAKMGKEPDKEYKGSFNVRVKPDIHRMAVAKSKALRISLNQLVERVLEKEVMKK